MRRFPLIASAALALSLFASGSASAQTLGRSVPRPAPGAGPELVQLRADVQANVDYRVAFRRAIILYDACREPDPADVELVLITSSAIVERATELAYRLPTTTQALEALAYVDNAAIDYWAMRAGAPEHCYVAPAE